MTDQSEVKATLEKELRELEDLLDSPLITQANPKDIRAAQDRVKDLKQLIDNMENT